MTSDYRLAHHVHLLLGKLHLRYLDQHEGILGQPLHFTVYTQLHLSCYLLTSLHLFDDFCEMPGVIFVIELQAGLMHVVSIDDSLQQFDLLPLHLFNLLDHRFLATKEQFLELISFLDGRLVDSF